MRKLYRFLLILIMPFFLFTSVISCSDDDKDIQLVREDNKYLKSVVETEVTRASIVKMYEQYLSGINLPNTILSMAINNVTIAKITYQTKDVNGNQIIASGLIAMPSGEKVYTELVSIQHSTLDINKAPSSQGFYYELIPAAMGKAVIMADYLGYGVSQTADLKHPYLHVESTGIVCADMIEAALEYFNNKGIKSYCDDVELLGYSQGAHASLATLKEIEKRGKRIVYKVTVGAGAFDINKVMNQIIASTDTKYERCGYIPYVIRGMEYGENLNINHENIYSKKVMDSYVDKFNTTMLSQWHAMLGNKVSDVINPDFYTEEKNSDIKILTSAFEKNSFVNMSAPKKAITVYHSKSDDFVPYACSESLKNAWGNKVELKELSSVGHTAAGIEFMLKYIGLDY